MSGGIGTTAETVGGVAGGIAGGFVGGAVGSVFGPVGTVAGRWAGSRLGQWGGRAAGGYLASKMNGANDKAEPKDRTQDKSKDKAEDDCVGDCKKNEEERKKAAQKRAKDIVDNPEQFRGQDKADVEQQLDKDLRNESGWTKEPINEGTGSKYTSPNGNQQIRLNDGYPDGSTRGDSDPLHSGPYLKSPSNGKSVPLRGNPALNIM
ncbi:hypothetical protein [Methylobacterium sp. Leaf469]|uniref:hypothetical protein n=1 Tax=Methylobacterium sp. Leaf469 TaxID=1736387 RepID=UPI000AA8BE86|nr:hypothetical protein [Methylobacterium sp. Leaf469]